MPLSDPISYQHSCSREGRSFSLSDKFCHSHFCPFLSYLRRELPLDELNCAVFFLLVSKGSPFCYSFPVTVTR